MNFKPQQLIQNLIDYSYNNWKIRKSNGKLRIISEPNPELKKVQYKILTQLEQFYIPNQFSHAFIKGRSIVTASLPHIGKTWIITVDIKNFFDSITRKQLKSLTYVLDLSPTEVENFIKIIGFEDQDGIPQGAPTSPIISDMIFNPIDFLLQYIPLDVKLPGITDFSYTRYADDLIFSFNYFPYMTKLEILEIILPEIERRIIPFMINRNKIYIYHHTDSQTILGLTVNERITITKTLKNSLRGHLHTLGYNNLPIPQQITGQLAFIQSIDPKIKNKLIETYNNAKLKRS